MAVRITQVKSPIGHRRDHRGTLRALGVGRIGQSAVHEDTPTFRGMVHQVAYLVSVESENGDAAPKKRASTARKKRTSTAKAD